MNYNVCSSLIRLGLCQILAYIVVIVMQYIPKAEGFTISVKGLKLVLLVVSLFELPFGKADLI